MNIYVGNLSYDMNEADLLAAFEDHGSVDSAKIIMDRETGRSKGFGFVEMPDDGEGQAAIQELNEALVSGRPLKVNEAKPRREMNQHTG
ncbi:MAG: RNA recognition motif-containing protein [Gammaproteobacteria bacterium]|jgi:RNA recognition motif-containing protein